MKPVLLTRRYWSAKRVAILIGFVLTILGPIGAQFVVDPAQDAGRVLEGLAKDTGAEIDALKASQAQYFMFEQQGALVFALDAAGLGQGQAAQKAMLDNLYQLSLLSRANAMRQVIGELARGRMLQYQPTADAYLRLVEAARKEVSLATYKAVDDFEAGMMAKANSRMATLQDNLLKFGQARADADRLAGRRKLMLLVVSMLGAAFLLAANLLSTREEEAAEVLEEAGEGSPQAMAELAVATKLMEAALGHARELNAPKPG
jgi:hypothetical protein